MDIATERIIIQAKIELARQLMKESYSRIRLCKVEVASSKHSRSIFGVFEDCGDAYDSWYENDKIRLECAIAEKIRLEKTMRFYKHRLKELEV